MRTCRTFVVLIVAFLLVLNVAAAYAADTPVVEEEGVAFHTSGDNTTAENTLAVDDPEEKPPQADGAQMWTVGAMGVNATDLRLVSSYLVNDSTWIDNVRFYGDVYYANSDERFGAGVSAEYVPLDLPFFDRVGVGAHLTDGDSLKADFYIMKTLAPF